jgi:hypothetical protein
VHRPPSWSGRAASLHAACGAGSATARRRRDCAPWSGLRPPHQRRRPTQSVISASSRVAQDWRRRWESKGFDQGPRLDRSRPDAPGPARYEVDGSLVMSSRSHPRSSHRHSFDGSEAAIHPTIPAPAGLIFVDAFLRTRPSMRGLIRDLDHIRGLVRRNDPCGSCHGSTPPWRVRPRLRARSRLRQRPPRTRAGWGLPDAAVQKPAIRRGRLRAAPSCRSCAN